MPSQLGRRALQRSLGAPATPATARTARRIPCAASQARWLASEKGPRSNGPSFKGQMLESITARLARQKEDLRRSALEREARNRGGAFPVTACKYHRRARLPALSRPLATDCVAQLVPCLASVA